jgi:hypothetical protein
VGIDLVCCIVAQSPLDGVRERYSVSGTRPFIDATTRCMDGWDYVGDDVRAFGPIAAMLENAERTSAAGGRNHRERRPRRANYSPTGVEWRLPGMAEDVMFRLRRKMHVRLAAVLERMTKL